MAARPRGTRVPNRSTTCATACAWTILEILDPDKGALMDDLTHGDQSAQVTHNGFSRRTFIASAIGAGAAAATMLGTTSASAVEATTTPANAKPITIPEAFKTTAPSASAGGGRAAGAAARGGRAGRGARGGDSSSEQAEAVETK